MDEHRSQVRDYAIYVVARAVVCVFQIVSNSTAQTLIAALAWLAFILDRRHRLIGLDNLRKAFPNRYTEAELNALVLATYRHFLSLMVEMSLLPRKMHKHNAKFYYDMGPDEQAISTLLRSDRPVLMVTGHFGNWEIAGFGCGLRGFPTYAVARELNNPYLENLVRRFREHNGQKILANNGNLTQLKAALANGGKIAVLTDQSAGPRGLMVDFFGRPASIHKGVAVLALQYRAPLLVFGCRKVAEPMRYQVFVEDIIYPEDYPGLRAEAVRRISQRYMSALERVIRTAPAQYFWLNNRWKQFSRPSAARAA